MSRQGRRQPAPRRTAPGRAGGPRRTPPPRRAASRAERPPAPTPPYEDVPHLEESYDDGFPPEDAYGAPPAAPERGRKPKKSGKRPKKRGKAARPARPSGRPGGPERQSGPARRAGGPGPRLYFGAAAALGALVLLGAGAVAVLGGGDDAPAAAPPAKIGTPAGTGVSPVSYSSSPSSAAYAGIASRSADSQPLTIGEAFPASAAKVSVPEGEATLKLRAKRLDGDCAAAVWGGSVGAELGRGGCTQAVRGIYSDTRRGYALAVAVFNLAGSADAERFVAKLETTIGAGFVRPLEAPAPLDAFGRGFGMARGLAMGHFAVVSWAQRLDGKGDEKDETLLSLLIEGGKAPAVLGRAARASE